MEQIKAVREKTGMAQAQISRLLGLSDKTIAGYENETVRGSFGNALIVIARNAENVKILLELQKESFSDNVR